jgi:hypothetical protein
LPTIRLSEYQDAFVIHFGGEFTRVNAYTLATTLVGLADAAKAANAVLNPGYEVEVVVEALGAGSFRAKIRAVYHSAGNLFSREALRGIVVGVIAGFIVQLSLGEDVTVNVYTDEVIIEKGSTRVVVPRETYDSIERVKPDAQFRTGVGRVFRAVEDDGSIRDVGIGTDLDEPTPPIRIPRESFVGIPERLFGSDSDKRDIVEITDVRITRAILERSRRRWQFIWNGIRISAAIRDNAFYDDFIAHRITVAPGDRLHVRMRIRQQRDPEVGVFFNTGYEILEVLDHISVQPFQSELPDLPIRPPPDKSRGGGT